MSPTPSQSQSPAVPAPTSHRRHPLGSALPLLSTMAATLLIAIVVIVLAATQSPVSMRASNLLLI